MSTIVDRRYFKEFTSGQPTPDVIVEPVVSKVTKVWTTVFARKIVGRNGEIIGFASRGVEPTHFEDFVGSLALNNDTAISMIHRDGTIIARYPQDEKLVGQNVAKLAVVSAGACAERQYLGTLQAARCRQRTRSARSRSLTHFPIVIVATTKTSTALADWRAQTKLQFFAAALAIVVVVVMIFLIVRQLRRQHAAAQHKLSEKIPASRHRHQQHDAGPAAVRCLGPAGDLQPAIYRHVRRLAATSSNRAAICAT